MRAARRWAGCCEPTSSRCTGRLRPPLERMLRQRSRQAQPAQSMHPSEAVGPTGAVKNPSTLRFPALLLTSVGSQNPVLEARNHEQSLNFRLTEICVQPHWWHLSRQPFTALDQLDLCTALRRMLPFAVPGGPQPFTVDVTSQKPPFACTSQEDAFIWCCERALAPFIPCPGSTESLGQQLSDGQARGGGCE